MSTDIAIKRRLSDMIIQYEIKKEAIPEELKKFEQAGENLKTACTIDGTYGQERIDIGSVYDRNMQSNLLRSAWLNLHKTLSLDTLMSAKDQKRFDQSLSHLPEFTIENIRATFGDYILNPMGNILRGLAEVFSDLDQSFKSHEKVKIGVEGLPKRIIISGFGGYSSYGWEKLRDVVNALASYRGEKMVSHWDLSRAYEASKGDFLTDRGMNFKRFQNGNGHLFFNPTTLKDINRALAEYYGEVLADCHEQKPANRQQSTAVSKDLQYYPTPKDVVERVLDDIFLQGYELILEPSCGCGRIMDGIREKFPKAIVHGVEVDHERAELARSKGHKVITANFLETEPTPKYDRVIMNPPFYGKHYAKHIEHAIKFLKPDGVLTSILPITARTDHGLLKGKWSDLPIGSFRESGTNINTTVFTMRANP